MLLSLTYLSRSVLPEDSCDDTVARIIERSIEWNSSHGITGGLLFTGRHFAQTLEGEEFEVLGLIEMIRQDPRHERLHVLCREPIAARSFSAWWMAYRGRTSFIDRKVEAAHPDSKAMQVTTPGELRELIKLFAFQRALAGEPGMRAEPRADRY